MELKITVIGALELKHTSFMVRLGGPNKDKEVQLDPYVAVDVDEVPFASEQPNEFVDRP